MCVRFFCCCWIVYIQHKNINNYLMITKNWMRLFCFNVIAFEGIITIMPKHTHTHTLMHTRCDICSYVGTVETAVLNIHEHQNCMMNMYYNYVFLYDPIWLLLFSLCLLFKRLDDGAFWIDSVEHFVRSLNTKTKTTSKIGPHTHTHATQTKQVNNNNKNTKNKKKTLSTEYGTHTHTHIQYWPTALDCCYKNYV